MNRSCDVLVVGAGPAGIAAAITAREQGLDAVVVDKSHFPRDKTCGDGLTTNALRLLERFGLSPERLPGYEQVGRVVIVSPSGRRVEMELPSDGHYAAVVRRVELDAALVDLAMQRGVEILQGRAAAHIDDTGEQVELTLDDGTTFAASWVIAADGHYSTVRKLLSPDHRALGEWTAFRQYFRGVPERRLFVLFERDLLPGYAWVFPLPDERANVGFALLRSQGMSGKVIARRWRELLGRASLRAVLGPDAEPEAPHRAWPIAGEIEQLAAGRVLFVGDAGGLVDPMTGEGIAQALESGMLAAAAIASSHDPAVTYQAAIHRDLARDLRFAKVMRAALARQLTARAAIRAVDATDWTRDNFARWMFEDYPRAVLLTPSRWHRRMLSGVGAFAEP